jgi:transmembrane sensor
MQLTAAVGAVALVAVIAFGIYLAECLPTYYKTDIGERRVVALPDGSRISMDSDTRVQVEYGKNARAITLDRGRSRFDVAHDTSRPFTVTAGHQTVVAVVPPSMWSDCSLLFSSLSFRDKSSSRTQS